MSIQPQLNLEPGTEIRHVLSRVRRLLHADTAVVLLVDATGAVLEPVAASGLDITLRAGARVPVGKGFAGAIVSSGQPLSVEDIAEAELVNPVLQRRGVKSLLGAPLKADGSVLGVLHVGSLRPRVFSPADIDLLVDLAAELGPWITEQALAENHRAALVLQRSLIPTIPQFIEGLDLAGRYIPADGDLGGDWYDVFSLPHGRVGFVMGDVLGHGLQPAVVMGRLRSALRSYALIETSPARVLEMLDREIGHFEPGTLATVILAVSEPPFESFVVSSAGHWPPFVTAPAIPARQIEIDTDPILGLLTDSTRRDYKFSVPDAGSLCFFTDGLIEQRNDLDGAVSHERGLAAVAHHISASASAESNCVRILSNVLPEQGTSDDVALLIVRRGD